MILPYETAKELSFPAGCLSKFNSSKQPIKISKIMV
jgi:hypothetical protein